MIKKELNIILVDDNDSFREGMRYFIRLKTKWTIIQEYSSGLDFKNDIALTERPDFIFMDYHLPDIDGIFLAKQYLLENPKTNVIAITMFAHMLYLDELIMAGFKGCIAKNSVFELLIPAVEKVLKNGLFFQQNMKVNKFRF